MLPIKRLDVFLSYDLVEKVLEIVWSKTDKQRRVSKCRWWKMHPAEILTKKNILLQHIKLICLIMKIDYDRKGDGSVL